MSSDVLHPVTTHRHIRSHSPSTHRNSNRLLSLVICVSQLSEYLSWRWRRSTRKLGVLLSPLLSFTSLSLGLRRPDTLGTSGSPFRSASSPNRAHSAALPVSGVHFFSEHVLNRAARLVLEPYTLLSLATRRCLLCPPLSSCKVAKWMIGLTPLSCRGRH